MVQSRNTVKKSSFTTRSFAPHHRVDAFRSFQGPVFDITIPHQGAPDFDHTNHFWRFEENVFMQLETGKFTQSRAAQSDDLVESRVHVILVNSGKGLMAIDGHASPISPGLVLIYHMLSSRYVHNETKRSGLAFNFPSRLIGYNPKLHPSVMFFGAGQPQAEALALQMRTIHKLLIEDDGETAAWLFGGLREVVRSTISGDSIDRSRTDFRSLRFRSMLNHIDANLLNDNLTPDYLGSKFGMSRAALYRAFDPLGGISHYVTQRRLDRAHRLLGEEKTIAPIGTIARWLHFHDAAHFSNAFKKRFGARPTDVRKTLHQSRGATTKPPISEARTDLSITLSKAFF